MRNEKRVKELLEMLKSEMTIPRELKIVEEFEMKLNFVMPEIEIIDENRKKFNGIVYYKNTRDGRFVSAISIYKAVWRYFYGEIPQNYDIHHKDFDKYNDDISNLQMLTKEEHKKIHSESGKKTDGRQILKLVCKTCGKEYEAVNVGRNGYCSKKCAQKALREVRICEICGKKFRVSKYDPTKCCSKKCTVEYVKNKTHEKRTCPFCGKEFDTYKKRAQRYCSRDCYFRAKKESKQIVEFQRSDAAKLAAADFARHVARR